MEDRSSTPWILRALEVASHWYYLGEGNANAVFRYRGPREELRPFVLRVAKTCPRSKAGASRRNDDEATSRNWEYTCKTIAPRIGHNYIPRGFLLSTSGNEAFLLGLNEEVLQNSKRPAKRLDSSVALGASHVLLLEDCTTTLRAESLPLLAGDIFCFEIKPKSPQLLTLGSGSRGRCRFCLKQTVLAQSKSEHERSFYCPRRMFSFDATEVKKSLYDLLHTPQNNLRVFWDGVEMRDGNMLDALHRFHRSPFMKELAIRLREMGAYDTEKPAKLLLECVAEALVADKVLKKLDTIQQSGNCEYIDDIFSEGMFAGIINNGLDRVLDRINLPVTPGHCTLTGLTLAARRITNYLLARTMMDCSVMVSLKGVFSPRDHFASDCESGHTPTPRSVTTTELRDVRALFYYDIRVVDTDRKSLRKLPDYMKAEKVLRQCKMV